MEEAQFWQNYVLMQTQSKSLPGTREKQSESGQAAMPAAATDGAQTAPQSQEFGGPTGPEPTRYGDWEKKGRCIDF